MNGTVCDTQLGCDEAQLVPDKISKIKKQEEAEKHQREVMDERSTIASAAKIDIGHRLRKPEKPSSSQLRRLYQRSGCNGLATKAAIPRPTVCAESDTEKEKWRSNGRHTPLALAVRH